MLGMTLDWLPFVPWLCPVESHPTPIALRTLTRGLKGSNPPGDIPRIQGDEFTMDDHMLMELLALGIDAKMSVPPDESYGGQMHGKPFRRFPKASVVVACAADGFFEVSRVKGVEALKP